MKTLAFLLPGTIALCLSAFPMKAQASPTLTGPTIQAKTGQTSGQMSGVKLTDVQKAKMKEIRQRSAQQINDLLRTDQKDKYKAARKQGLSQQKALQSLGLDSSQKMQIKKIMQAARQDIQKVLTPTQLEQIRQNKGKGVPTA
jgi:Spy/CpxP family protein refolding chaperone